MRKEQTYQWNIFLRFYYTPAASRTRYPSSSASNDNGYDGKLPSTTAECASFTGTKDNGGLQRTLAEQQGVEEEGVATLKYARICENGVRGMDRYDTDGSSNRRNGTKRCG